MLGWTKNKSDHPMADERGAQDFLADLPAGDSFKTLTEITFWLDATRTAEGLKPQRVYEITDLLDSAAKPHLRKLAQDYLNGGSRTQRFQEHRIWSTSIEYWRQLAAAYEFCLTQPLSGIFGAGGPKHLTPTITSRALRAHALELKWSLLRYALVDNMLWDRARLLYARAEQGEYATTTCTVYPGSESTVEREYLKALMLSVCAADSLPPRQQEIAERVIAEFAEYFVFQSQDGDGCYYYVDLAQAQAPVRKVKRGAPAPTLRFFGPGQAAEVAQEVIRVIADSGAIPSYLNLGGSYDSNLVTDVLHHLSRYWGTQPPTRDQERRKTFDRIHVIHDFNDVFGTVTAPGADRSLELRVETWTVENESRTGYGAVIEQASGDWLKVGALLGVKLEDSNCWDVGIVRRLASASGKNRYVGIQQLAKGATAVKLFPIGAQRWPAPEGEDAVLLPSLSAEQRASGDLNLLMRMGTFSPRQQLRMRIYQRNYLIAPKALIEGGQDFDMAQFRVIQRAD